MRIKELYIKAFGKFIDREFKLGDNLNIIYGLNETGKSTIHRFIEAMLFGFVKPGVKRRVLMEEYDRYRPWTGELYGGSLVYQVGGRLYKVERNLEKGRESVRVFDHVTGEELTRSFTYDKARRELLFAREHLGVSHSFFRNTISVSQLGSKSDADLAREIQTYLGNLGSAGDANLSVAKAEKLIKEYLDGIGTERAQTKEYGRLCRRIEELENGIKAAAASVEKIRLLGRQLREDEERAEALKAERKKLEQRIKALKGSMLLGRWQEVQRLSKECKALALQLEELKEYAGFDTAERDELYTLDRLAEQDRQEIKRIQLKVEESSRDIEMAQKEVSEALDKGAGPLRKRFYINLGLCTVSAAAALGAIILAAVLESPVFGVLSIPLAALFLYLAVRSARLRRNLKEQEGAGREIIAEIQYMEKYRDDLLDSLSARKAELARREESILSILHKCGAAGIEDYRDKEAGFERYRQLKDRLGQLQRLLEVRLDGESYEALERKAEAVMAAGAGPIDVPAAELAAGEGAGADQITMSAVEQPDRGTANASPIDMTVAELAAAGFGREDLEGLEIMLRHIMEEEARLLAGVEKARGGLEALEQAISILPEMEEELSGARERLKRLDYEREAAEIALEAIREASTSVHREFAPALNRKINEITSRITAGRYTDLQVTRELEILATAPETGRRVEAEVLSGGTVDQLYFALRIAASDLVSGGSKLPLFLDDSFVQYDRRRLENVMGYLLEEAKERQIILFTCHGREREVADALGGVYNYLVID
ncbi:MAG TPA: AAA family ATPase [Bacillota bacterium]|nr:AAA family ATPase [Bacillota bacterium]